MLGSPAGGPEFGIQVVAQYSTFNSNLSPGFFTPYDMPAFVFTNTVDEDTEETIVRIVDVQEGDILVFKTDPQTGELKEQDNLAQPLVTLDADDTPTEVVDDIRKLVLTRLDGTQLEFRTYDVYDGAGPGDDNETRDKDGRLTQITDRNGNVTAITYQDPTGTKISTVTGPDGLTLTFAYGAHLLGRDCLSSVTFPNGTAMTFTYSSSGFLASASIAGLWQWTCGVSQDPVAQTTNFAVQDGTGGVTTMYTQDYIELDGYLLDQPEAIVRAQINGAGENIYSIFFDPSDANTYLVWRGNDFLSKLVNGRSEALHDRLVARQSERRLLGVQRHARNRLSVQQLPPGTPDVQFRLGAPTSTTNAAGYTVNYQYDGDYFKTRATYGDATYETWQYNSFHQPTRDRDRLAA